MRILRISVWVIIVLMLVLMIQRLPKKNVVDLDSTKDDWAKLMLVLNSVDKDYVDDIDHKAVTEKLLPAVMAELDPHSVYLHPVDLEKADEALQGGFDGIGIQFNVPNDTAIVTNVIAGGPSEKAGLLSGDRIIKIDDQNVAGVSLHQDSMVSMMRGPRGTKVRLELKRNGEDKLIPFTIVRDMIPVNSVDVAFMINDTTGYIKLAKFSKTSYFEFLQATLTLRE